GRRVYRIRTSGHRGYPFRGSVVMESKGTTVVASCIHQALTDSHRYTTLTDATTMPRNRWTGSDFSKNRAGGRSNERAPERRYFRRIFRRITGWFLRLFRGNLAGAFMVIDVVRQRSVTYSIN